MNYLIPNFIQNLCFLLLASLSDIHALSNKVVVALNRQVDLIADNQSSKYRQPEQVSLPYPGVIGPEDPNSAADNAKEVPIQSHPFPIGPVGPQHQVDIPWPQVNPIRNATGWLPPVDPSSAARNAQFGLNNKHGNKRDVASLTEILIVYGSMYVPLVLCGLYCVHSGWKQKHSRILAPVAYVFVQIGEDLVNQSLVDRMNDVTSPLIVLKALAVLMFRGPWLLTRTRSFLQAEYRKNLLFAVIAVGALYSCHQLLNPALYSENSLMEYAVITNFWPPVAFLCEFLLITEDKQPKVNRKILMSICAIVISAFLFSDEGSGFLITSSLSMLGYAAIMLAFCVSQRWYILQTDVTVSVPIVINACCLLLPAIVLSLRTSGQWWYYWQSVHDLSVVVMMILAVLAYVGKLCLLVFMLKTGPATNVFVLGNLANFGVVCLGLLLFHEARDMTIARYLGLVVLLASGLWYCFEATDNGEASQHLSGRNQDDKISKDSLDTQISPPSTLENSQVSNSRKNDD